MSDPWKDEIIDALYCRFIYRKELENDPVEAIGELIHWEVMMALDPKVSSAARDLMERGRMLAFWDEWRGDFKDRAVMWIKRIAKIPLFMSNEFGKMNLRIDLHKMVAADAPGCFHTHPGWSFRIVLHGGYYEEVEPVACDGWKFALLCPGAFGFVRPDYCHRIHALVNGKSSYSLWLRGPVIADVTLVGEGWPHGKLGVHRGRN